MRFLFATDLHGDENKYYTILDFAKKQSIKLIHLGADILPKHGKLLPVQGDFVVKELPEFCDECAKNNIGLLLSFGNDDLYVYKGKVKEYSTLLDESPYFDGKYVFTAYNFVPDYPFTLKTACKLDYIDCEKKEEDFGEPIDINEGGIFTIKDIKRYFGEKGTIENDLKYFSSPHNNIVYFHSPPYNLELDVCANGKRVGSRSIYNWIERNQPLLVLSGHIHESPHVSKIWKNSINKSIVIQPGQPRDETSVVLIEVENENIKADLITLENC